MRIVQENDETGMWDVIEQDAAFGSVEITKPLWLAEFESESLAKEFALAPMVREEFSRLLHVLETPGDFSKLEISDALLEAGALASKLEEV